MDVLTRTYIYHTSFGEFGRLCDIANVCVYVDIKLILAVSVKPVEFVVHTGWS